MGGGAPAKFIRKRFDDEAIEKLLSIQWWQWDEQKIRQYAGLFDNVDSFIDEFVRAEKDNV